MARWVRAGVALLAASTAAGCGAPDDAVDGDVKANGPDEEVGKTSQQFVWGISQALLDFHHAWHTGGRSTTNTGQDFLIFHRNFLAKMATEFRATGGSSVDMAPWSSVPPELKTAALGWNATLAAAETRIITNNPPFANENELGMLIESTIHNWIHQAAAVQYNEPAIGPIHNSPSSTYFFKIHGMVDLWWSRWLGAKQLHVASAANSVGDYTRLDHPLLNNRPFARVIVTQNWRTSGPYNAHNIGVWYDGSRWAIFNEDLTSIPVGAAFNVQVEGGILTQTAYSGNSAGDFMFLDHPLSGSAGAAFWAIHNYNPPEVPSQYNNHPLGVWFPGTGSRWTVFNQDLAAPLGAAFNVLMLNAVKQATGDVAFKHTAIASNIVSNYTIISNSWIDGKPNAQLIVTPNYNSAVTGAVYNNHPIGVWYTGTKWAIFNEDLQAMPLNASFNVDIQG